ncbi:phage holin family protein [Microbacterium gorillae]|uniref:phage holin family protein n=1 Tax=Microbacterium gorillae TaxID=1231063 RepID=UPI003D9966A6
MVRFLIRAGIFLGTAALALLLIALLVPGAKLSVAGFIVAVVVFAVAQSLLAPLADKLTREHAPALIGGVGLVSTFVALLIASLFPGGLVITGIGSWVLATVIGWVVTALGSWLLPKVFLKAKPAKR